MVKNMSSRYVNMTMKELLTLRSKKTLRILKLESKRMGYLDQEEHKREKELVAQINAEIACRVDQLPLFK